MLCGFWGSSNGRTLYHGKVRILKVNEYAFPIHHMAIPATLPVECMPPRLWFRAINDNIALDIWAIAFFTERAGVMIGNQILFTGNIYFIEKKRS